jgi:adenine-specific DNA-methyltransferase
MKKLDMLTPDMVAKNLDAIAELFPQVITEKEDGNGNMVKAIDYDLFRQMLSGELIEWSEERYRLDWPGKRASILKANTPINKTLRPVVKDSVNWDTTGNLYIEWDNFEVLKVLQESYLWQVKMIYIDPPYNTGKDFVYTDNFKISKESYEEWLEIVDEEWGRLVRNTDTNGRFHSDWLSMMYERLTIARDLLSDDGVIFISIDDNEVHNLRKVCDEVFGGENFVSNFIWKSKPQGGNDNKIVVTEHEYIYLYTRNISNTTLQGRGYDSNKYKQKDEFVEERGGYNLAKMDLSVLPYRPNLDYPVECPDGSTIFPGAVTQEEWEIRKKGNNKDHDWRWRWSSERFKNAVEKKFIEFKNNNGTWTLYTKEYEFVDNNCEKIDRSFKHRTIIDDVTSVNGTRDFQHVMEQRLFSYPKPVDLIKKLILSSTNGDDLILDFFAGSGTTAHAVMAQNAEDGGKRRFIMVQIPEKTDKESEAYKAGYPNISEIGKERIRRAGKKIIDENKDKEWIEKLDIGFRVYKLDDSNMKDVYYHPTSVKQSALFELTSNIKEDRTPEDLLAQVMVDLGLTLDLPIETRSVAGSTVYFVAGNSLIACFDEKIDFAIVDELAPLSPLKVVFRDNSFRSDADRINFETRFKKVSPDTVLQVL